MAKKQRKGKAKGKAPDEEPMVEATQDTGEVDTEPATEGQLESPPEFQDEAPTDGGEPEGDVGGVDGDEPPPVAGLDPETIERYRRMRSRYDSPAQIQTIARARGDQDVAALCTVILGGTLPEPDPFGAESDDAPADDADKPFYTPPPQDTGTGLTEEQQELLTSLLTEIREQRQTLAQCEQAIRGFMRITSSRTRRAYGPRTSTRRADGKMSLVEAALHIMREIGGTFKCPDLVRMAEERGLWERGDGKTPEATLNATLVTEINKKPDTCRFVKTSPGQYGASTGPGTFELWTQEMAAAAKAEREAAQAGEAAETYSATDENN